MRPNRLTSRSKVCVAVAPVAVLGLTILLPSATTAAAPQVMEAMVRQAAHRIESVSEQVTDSLADQNTVVLSVSIDQRPERAARPVAINTAPVDEPIHLDGLAHLCSHLALPPPALIHTL